MAVRAPPRPLTGSALPASRERGEQRALHVAGGARAQHRGLRHRGRRRSRSPRRTATSTRGEITVEQLRHADGRAFTVVQFYAGDTAVGADCAAGTSVPVAVISDGAVESCTAL